MFPPTSPDHPDFRAAEGLIPAPGLIPLPPNDDALIRAADAPSYIGIARQTLARWRTEGTGPRYVKLGRLVFYRTTDLRQWIAERVRRNTAQRG